MEGKAIGLKYVGKLLSMYLSIEFKIFNEKYYIIALPLTLTFVIGKFSHRNILNFIMLQGKFSYWKI